MIEELDCVSCRQALFHCFRVSCVGLVLLFDRAAIVGRGIFVLVKIAPGF